MCRSGGVVGHIVVGRLSDEEHPTEVRGTEGMMLQEFLRRLHAKVEGDGSSERFIDLVRSIDDMIDEVRFRISSVKPNLLEDDIIRLIARSRRIAPHFHIPLQSGSNRVLELMQRRYTREVFVQKVAAIKSLMPHVFIGVDVIVGMRGETPDMFDETIQLCARSEIRH